MDEKQARKILEGVIQKDGRLDCADPYIWWDKQSDQLTLDGSFSAEELEALAWWIRREGDHE